MNWKNLHPNFGDAGWWNPPYPPALYELLSAHIREGAHALDLGTGQGVLAYELASRGMHVVGIDKDEAMLQRARTKQSDSVVFKHLCAEDLADLGETFDLLTAGQCWHWFDGKRVAKEAFRVLRPHGCLAIVHYDWVSSPHTFVETTERLIRCFNAKWRIKRHSGLYPACLDHLVEARFQDVRSQSTDHREHYSVERWIQRVMCCAPISELSTERREEFREALVKRLDKVDRPDFVMHRLFIVTGQKQ